MKRIIIALVLVTIVLGARTSSAKIT